MSERMTVQDAKRGRGEVATIGERVWVVRVSEPASRNASAREGYVSLHREQPRTSPGGELVEYGWLGQVGEVSTEADGPWVIVGIPDQFQVTIERAV